MSDPTPAQIEASGVDTIDVVFKDCTFTVPATPDHWDFTTLELFEDGKAVKAVRAILGADQYEAFKSMNPKPTVKDFNEFMGLLAERYGFDSSGN